MTMMLLIKPKQKKTMAGNIIMSIIMTITIAKMKARITCQQSSRTNI